MYANKEINSKPSKHRYPGRGMWILELKRNTMNTDNTVARALLPKK